MTTIIDAALEYYDRGLNVIPIKHRSAKGKEPAIPEWKSLQRVRPSRDRVEKFFTKKNLDGLAVLLGPVSGYLNCQDYDNAAGRGEYTAWSERRPELAASLPTVETSRGRHVYFHWRADPPLRLEKYGHKGERGELRGEDHYVLLPPSVHPSGHVYKWITPLCDPVPTVDPALFGRRGDPIPTTGPLIQGPSGTERQEDVARNAPNALHALDALCQKPGPVEATANELELETILASTQPTGVGMRNACVFELARRLKGLAAFADAPAESMRPIVKRWHAMALSTIGTKSFEATWEDFVSAWARVKFPGADPFRPIMAIVEADLWTAPLPDWYENEATRRLALLCRELQRINGTKPFYLGCRTVENLIDGLCWRTASRRLAMLAADGLIRLETKGSMKGMRASRWRYVGP